MTIIKKAFSVIISYVVVIGVITVLLIYIIPQIKASIGELGNTIQDGYQYMITHQKELNEKIPFSTEDNVDHPISLYAATKKSNELMAHTYSYLYNIKTIGLRFFTVYGPWGRPDMAMFLFTDAILNNRPIKVFNNGNLSRDFTYIDDIINGITAIVDQFDTINLSDKKYKIYNIGNNEPVKLIDFISEIEKNTGITAEKEMLPMQPGDVEKTWANIDELITDTGYTPKTSIKEGVANFINWYKNYYQV